MLTPRSHAIAFALVGLMASACGFAQAPPPPQPLGPPPIPAGNPLSTAKINLGKALFWEEQLSVTGTVACGSCHRSSNAGTDPRSLFVDSGSTHPGPDAVLGNADDVQGSAGVPAHDASGAYHASASFGMAPQVGRRKSPSTVNSAYSPFLFWDGRAGTSFADPISGQVLIAQGGALENQALAPLLDTSEMAPQGALVADIAGRIANARPLALAEAIPSVLTAWIAGRDYPALFNEAFGSNDITPARIAMAIASYERTLNSTQAPIDQQFAGQQVLTALELQGQQVFIGNDCAGCHAGNRFTDDNFRYIGVRPVNDDLGRFAQTGNNPDRGAFKVPSLRNIAQRAPYMHNGRFATLEEVVEFYNRGGDFNAPNKDPRVRPRNLTQQQKNALLAFLRRPLSDPRVGAEQAPFDRPTLYTESTHVPVITGNGSAGSGGIVPTIIALEPALLGNANFTVAIDHALGGAVATLIVSSSDPDIVSPIPSASFASATTTVSASGEGSVHIDLGNDPALLGQTLYGRFYVADPAAANGLAITAAFRITVFGEVPSLLMRDGFE
jgi:cytochrome c peroxidase